MSPQGSEAFCFEAVCESSLQAEIAGAEAWEAGALGVEERDESSEGILLLLYTDAASLTAVRDAVAAVPGVQARDPEAVPAQDWSQAWREGLEAVRVGQRLVVRPSWIDVAPVPGGVEVVIDPGQAFGTGGHVSTRLALEWIEELSREEPDFAAGSRVLDVGTGTGVLALSALALGAGSAVGFDLDPESGVAAREWAARNGFEERLEVFVGSFDSLDASDFDWLVANLLKREMLPLAADMAKATRSGGQAVFSGLLAAEAAEVEGALGAVGFVKPRRRTEVDANGDEWIALLMSRA
jgi:ribosomal protein L11 methyltransferase